MAITDLESRVPPSADADSYKLVGGPLFAEWKLVKKEDENTKHPLVFVTPGQIRWTKFASERYSQLESLDLVSRWAFDRARSQS